MLAFFFQPSSLRLDSFRERADAERCPHPWIPRHGSLYPFFCLISFSFIFSRCGGSFHRMGRAQSSTGRFSLRFANPNSLCLPHVFFSSVVFFLPSSSSSLVELLLSFGTTFEPESTWNSRQSALHDVDGRIPRRSRYPAPKDNPRTYISIYVWQRDQ